MHVRYMNYATMANECEKECNASEVLHILERELGFTEGSFLVIDFGKENEAFKIQCGYLDGRVLTQADVKALASLPSKEVLLARVVGGIQTPISRFVSVLSGTVRQVVNVLDAIAKKKGTSAPAQESTPKQSESEGEVK